MKKDKTKAKVEETSETDPEVLESKENSNGSATEPLTDLQDKFVRLAAEFDNFRKRSFIDKEQAKNWAKADMVLELLPVLNNLQLALKHAPAEIDPNWRAGIEHILRQFDEVLESQGFALINDASEQFDHNRHEAISHEDSEQPEDSIIEIVEAGLRRGDTILKPARVRVSKGK